MSEVIDFNAAKPAEKTPEEEFYYTFTPKAGEPVTIGGILSFNPIFAGIVTQDGKLLFATMMNELVSIRRGDPVEKTA